MKPNTSRPNLVVRIDEQLKMVLMAEAKRERRSLSNYVQCILLDRLLRRTK